MADHNAVSGTGDAVQPRPRPVDQRLLQEIEATLFKNAWYGRETDWRLIRQRCGHLSDDEYGALLREGIAQSQARIKRDSQSSHDRASVCLVC